MKKILQFLFAFLAIGIGLYPWYYILMGLHFGLLDSKSQELLANVFWNIGFYTHISLGGIALMLGWVLFSKKLRARNIQIHRLIGKVYVITALGSAFTGIFIGFNATGGWITACGFVSLGILWFYTTGKAYLNIRAKNIIEHEKMMIYSYAICFAAVMLRLWLPIFIILSHDFISSYRLVSWWCWVPNIVVASLIIRKKERARIYNYK